MPESTKKSDKIYRPDIIKEKPLPLDPESIDYSDRLADAVGSDGLIPVMLEESVVKQRISHDLYADPSSGLRELFANEFRACRTAKNDHGASPSITITINPSDTSRKLVIEGKDSMGMGIDLFLNVARYLGRSDNFSGKDPGQFGFGLASYTCLSDIMILETYSRDTGEKFAVMGKNGVGFNILPEPSDLDEYGTRISMTLKEGISVSSLIDSLVKFARFCEIDTYLVLENPTGSNGSLNRVGRHLLEKLDYKTHIDNVTRDDLGSRAEDGFTLVPIEIHEDDYDFYGVFAFTPYYYGRESYQSEMQYHKSWNANTETVILGLPIYAGINIPISFCICNIRNERVYKPTPDRERLTEKSAELLEKNIYDKITEILLSNEIKDPAEYDKHAYKQMYENRNNRVFEKFKMSGECERILDYINIHVMTSVGNQMRLKDVIKDTSSRHVMLRMLRAGKINVLEKAIPNAIIFRTIPANYPMLNRLLPLLNHTIVDGDQYIIDNGLVPTKNAVGRRLVNVRYRTWSSKRYPLTMETEKIMSDSLTWNIIRVTRPRSRDILRESMYIVKSDYRIVKDQKCLEGGVMYDDFISEIGIMQVHTSDGIMTVNDVVHSCKQIYITMFDDPTVLNLIKPKDQKNVISIMSNGNELFRLLAFMEEHGIEAVYENDDKERVVSFWNIMGMDKYCESNDLGYSYNTNRDTDFRVMVRLILYTNSFRNEQIQTLFVMSVMNCEASVMTIDELYKMSHALDKKIHAMNMLACGK